MSNWDKGFLTGWIAGVAGTWIGIILGNILAGVL